MSSAAVKPIDTHRTISAVWRDESAKVIARLARMVRDVGLAEELAHDALVAALEQWPKSGVPDNPGAWLTAAAKNRAIDLIRRNKLLDRKHDELGYQLEVEKAGSATIEDAADDRIGDDLLSLIFTACHPLLSKDARVTLTLRLLGGLTTDEIARAFLASESTIAQRIVRAKRILAEANVPFEVPGAEELAERLSSVLEVIYLIFNEGYSATAGDEWMRPALCEDALRLGRILAELMPRESEVHALVALMEIQASRTAARVSASGQPILLPDQNRTLWDHAAIRRGLAALQRAQNLGGTPGPYLLQAAIAACHARAPTSAQTEWTQIAALYAALSHLHPTPIVEINRAVAVSMSAGPQEALEILERVASEPALKNYHPLHAVRADLLEKLGRFLEAEEEFKLAASMTRNERERQLLLSRADETAKRKNFGRNAKRTQKT